MKWTYLITFALALAGSYLGSYVRKKGENRAVREDLDEINRKLENIKSEFVESNAYAAEKGKGLATKEDVGEITRTVEQVKSNIAMSLELIKLELGKKATIHRLAAEREFEALTEIGRFLYELQLATMGLRPLGIQRIPLNETEEQKQEKYQRRYDEWAKGHDAFMDAVEKSKLFLPHHLYLLFFNIRRLSFNEATDFRTALALGEGKLPPGTFEQAEKNIAEMSKAIDEAIVSIRQRYGIE